MNFFETYGTQPITSDDFDSKIILSSLVTCVFFWGFDCPNCEVAKKILIDRREELKSLPLKWYEANIYEDFELGTRFGLFGIPVFMFFKDGKKLGKISPFPGFDPFLIAIQKLLSQHEFKFFGPE